MPEWPEMEHYRRMLEVRIVNKQITGVHVERERSLNMSTSEFTNRVLGQHVTAVKRRAKMILFYLESKDIMLLHLMLGGVIYYGEEKDKPQRTVQVQLSFADQHIFFIGLRLGYLHLFTSMQLNERLDEHGPEPFDPELHIDQFQQLLIKHSGPLKKLLTDQSIIAGIGNCYSDEICFTAQLLPSRTAASLNDAEWIQLYRGMHSTLKEALEGGGYMDMAFFNGDTLTGSYNDRCKVYDREGENCYRCGQIIVRRDVTSKKSFHCPGCQR